MDAGASFPRKIRKENVIAVYRPDRCISYRYQWRYSGELSLYKVEEIVSSSIETWGQFPSFAFRSFRSFGATIDLCTCMNGEK